MPLLVELGCDLGILQVVSHVSDTVDDFGGISHAIRYVGWELKSEVGGGVALPANVNRKLLGCGLLDGNVFDEQSQHPLAVFGLRGGSMPQLRQIFGQGEDLRLLLWGSNSCVLALKLRSLLFELFQLKKSSIPAPF